MDLFRKKKVETEKLDYILKSTDLKLVLKVTGAEVKNLKKIPCLILGSETILQLLGGIKPYKLSIMNIGGFDYVEQVVFKIGKREICSGQETEEQKLELIYFDIHVDQILNLLRKKITQGELHLQIMDSADPNTFEYITLPLDFGILLEQLEKVFYEHLEFTTLNIEPHEEAYSPKELFFKIVFTPSLEIFSFERHNLEGELHFQKEYLEKKYGLHFTYDPTSLGLSRTNLDYVIIEVKDIEQFIKERDHFYGGQIIVKTADTTLVQSFKIDLTGIKRQALMKFYQPFTTWDETNLVAVTAVYKKNWNKFVDSPLLGPKTLYGSPRKPTIHFTLNHVVKAHGQGSWTDADRVLIMPFKDLVELNQKTLYGGTTVDFFFVGYTKLPKDLIMLDRNEGETWSDFEKRISDLLLDKGFKVMKGGEWAWDEPGILTWWDAFCEKRKWNHVAHFYTAFSEVEKMTYDHLKEKEYFGDLYLKGLQGYEEPIYLKYEKALYAWSSFWKRKKV